VFGGAEGLVGFMSALVSLVVILVVILVVAVIVVVVVVVVMVVVMSKRVRGPRLRGALLLRGRGNVGEMGARRRGRARFRVEVCDAREPSSTRGVRLPPREHATIAVGVRSCGLPSRLSGKRSALRAWACLCGPSAGGRAGLASRPARGLAWWPHTKEGGRPRVEADWPQLPLQ
jgi:hypothetical protein